MPHTRNPERLSHLPKVTQHRVCWWPGVTSLLCHSPALEAEGLSSFGAHDGWVVSFYPGAVKVETLGYLDPGIMVPGEASMKGRVWGEAEEKQRADRSEWAAGVRSVSVRFTQGYSAKGTGEKNGFLGPQMSS